MSLAAALDGGLAVPTSEGYLLSGRGYRALLDGEGLHYEAIVLEQTSPGTPAPWLELQLDALVVAGEAQALLPAGSPVQPGGIYGDALVIPYAGTDLVQLASARSDGVELEVWIKQRPSSEGDARLEFDLRGDLGLLVLETSRGEFSSQALGRRGAATIGRALAIDARGTVTELSSSLRAGRYSIELPESLLESASFPLRVDPLIGPQTPLATSGSTKDHAPDVVFDPIGGSYLVVWQRPTAVDNADVWGVRVDTSGIVVGSPFLIEGTSSVLAEAPRIAVDPNTGSALVVYEHEPAGSARTTGWTLLDANDSVVASNSVSASGFLSEGAPDVGFIDGPAGQSGFVLVNRRDASSAPDASILVTWIDAGTGAVLDSLDVGAGSPPRDGVPALPQSSTGASSVVVFQRFDTSSFDLDVFAACIDLSGGSIVLGSPVNVSNDATGADGNPDVASNGSGPYQIVWEHILSSVADRNVQGRELASDCSGTLGATLDLTSLGLLEFDAAAIQGNYGGPCDGQVLTVVNATGAPAGSFPASVLGVRWDSAGGSVGLLETFALGQGGVGTYSTPRAALDGTSTGFPRFLVVYDDDDGSTTPPGEVYAQVVTFDAIPISVSIAPTNPTSCVNDVLVLNSTITGSGNLSYQWRLNGVDIPGATQADLTITGVATADAGNYELEVSGPCGSPLVSNVATLTVEEQPTSIDVFGPSGDCAGASVTLTSAITGGSGSYEYQWLKDGALILVGATSPSLTIPSLQAADAGTYTLAVQSSCGVFTSPAHPLSVTEPPSGASLAASASSVCVGASAMLSASVAAGSGPFDYEFFLDGNSLGAASASDVLSIPAAALSDGGDYTVLVSNACGSTTSPIEGLTIDEAITGVIVASGTPAACIGDDVVLTASTATGTPQAYGWFKDGVFLTATSSDSLTLPNVQFADIGDYSVTPSNSCGNAPAATPFSLLVTNDLTAVTVSGPSSVCEGASVDFSANVTGGTLPTTSYQWSLDGMPIAGATSADLSILAAQPADAGSYTVEASNPCGSVTSAGSSLLVDAAPSAVDVLGPNTACDGGSVTLNASVTGGSGVLIYQWYRDGTPISGANAASLSLPALTSVDAGQYRVDVGNVCGSVSSPDHALAVVQAPLGVSISGPQFECPGNTLSLVANVQGGTASPSYQWSLDGTPIVGATSGIYTIASVTGADAGNYTVTVDTICSSIDSQASPLMVLGAPVGVTIDASAGTACVGAQVVLTANVPVGVTLPVSYQWLLDGAPLVGETGMALTIDPVDVDDGGTYEVDVSNVCATARSAPQDLVLLDVPQVSALEVSGTSVTLSWPWAPSGCANITQFEVLRATTAGGPYTVVGSLMTTGASCYTFVDDGTALPSTPAPTAGVTQHYVVQAIDTVAPVTIMSSAVTATPAADVAAGDVTGDGVVDGRDLLAMAAAQGACQGGPGWIPSANTASTSTCAPSSVCGLPGDPEQIDGDDADVVLTAFGSVIVLP